MNIQIFGTSKCFDTKKAQRYFCLLYTSCALFTSLSTAVFKPEKLTLYLPYPGGPSVAAAAKTRCV